eukprot:6487916-Amphidinium_carterae.1
MSLSCVDRNEANESASQRCLESLLLGGSVGWLCQADMTSSISPTSSRFTCLDLMLSSCEHHHDTRGTNTATTNFCLKQLFLSFLFLELPSSF